MKYFLTVLILCWISITVANDNNCYGINDSSDRQACLGDAYGTDNKDARNIILNHCYSLSDQARKNGLQQVCLNQKQGCYNLTDSDSRNACVSCNGSNKWARMFAVGYKMTCY